MATREFIKNLFFIGFVVLKCQAEGPALEIRAVIVRRT
jgi:hypothetical protein